MTEEALLFTLSAIGIAEAVYLIEKRKAGQRPICLIGSDCHLVLESKYSKVFFIHNDILGLLFYLAVSFLAALSVIGVGDVIFWQNLIQISVLSGALLSLYLIFLQWKIIKAWCVWCVLSAVTNLLMAIIILIGKFI